MAWPDPRYGEVEAANPAGQRLLDYYTEFHHSPGFPAKPRGEFGFFLPAHPMVTANNPPGVEPQPTPGMPRYELVGNVRLGGQWHKKGEVVAYIGWPLEAMRSVNPPAAAVTEYYSRNSESRRLLKSPWCCLRTATFLPPLSAAEDEQSTRELVHVPRKPPTVRPTRGARPRVSAA